MDVDLKRSDSLRSESLGSRLKQRCVEVESFLDVHHSDYDTLLYYYYLFYFCFKLFIYSCFKRKTAARRMK